MQGRIEFPAGFAENVRRQRPSFFAEHTAAFDAKTAKCNEVDAQLLEMERAEYKRYFARLDAKTMADLQTEAHTD